MRLPAFSLVVLASSLSLTLAAAAQRGEVTMTVETGARVTPIARFEGGRWVSSASCLPGDDGGRLQAGRGRLAVTGGASIQRPRSVVPGSEEWGRLAPTILTLFEEREREQRLTADRTSGAPPAVDWIYALDVDGGRTYYFEASRRVANTYTDVDADTDPPGTLRIAVAGFLREGSGGLARLGAKSELRWEQDGLPAGPSRPDLIPLGVLPGNGRMVWVMQGQSGASVWFSLYEIAAGGIRTVLTARLGRC